MHAYALLKPPLRPLALPDGVMHQLQVVGTERLAAVVEADLSLEALQQDDAVLLQAILAHDRVIRELFCQTTVLPLRFTSFPDMEELLLDLQTQEATYLETLTRLEGKAEYTLKLIAEDIPEVSISQNLKGKDYFLAKKQQYQEQEQRRRNQREQLDKLLQAIAELYPVLPDLDNQQVYLLISQASEAEMRQALLDLEKILPDLQFLLSNALPPFHFI